ncbi:MAG: alanine--tRNA ligase [Candidatus Daviesbacteria bacterium]|nr:alanine--tRNA ligase [Candidatus Daviesbacteria bacterium]
MKASELRQKYLDFFASEGHKVIPSAPLVPENDPSVLFTTAGMHPLVPYLLGEKHPEGKRLTDIQKCLRTDDIDEVGDICHHTFFEMLGNWSLGDYFKTDALKWSFEFLTSPEYLNLPKEKLGVSVFEGDTDAPFDNESYDIWLSLGIDKDRITKLPKKDNWWGPVGNVGPCGPDSEMFIWTGTDTAPKTFDPENKQWVEIWNDVFMQYNKTAEGKFEKLSQQNVDTGMGMERALALTNGVDDDYQTELFLPIIKKIEKITNKKYEENLKEFRIIADHFKASTFLILDGVLPANKMQGYVLRRLLRRSMVKMHQLSGKIWNAESIMEIVETILTIYEGNYNINTEEDSKSVFAVVADELNRFAKTLDAGLKEINKIEKIDGKKAFDLYQTYGFPLEITEELFKLKGQNVDHAEFEKEFNAHKELSRTASAGMFKGGLTEQTEIATKYHTATHLLNAALRKVLGEGVQQKGSNITADRLRFDFSHKEKLTEEQIKEIENLVNKAIEDNLTVTSEIMDKQIALESGALGFFIDKYGDSVAVYTISDPSTPSGRSEPPFSREICGGPHVKQTGELGKFKIIKEESASAGIRRIYAVLG